MTISESSSVIQISALSTKISGCLRPKRSKHFHSYIHISNVLRRSIILPNQKLSSEIYSSFIMRLSNKDTVRVQKNQC